MASTPDTTSNPLHTLPPEASRRLVQFLNVAGRPLERFLRIEAASGVLLLLAAAIALVCANSPWADGYAAFWQTPVGLRVGGLAFERPLDWLVNDGLMVIFFFVVGLEIRREIHCGELSQLRRAALPVAAAVGGMVIPAALYLALAGDPATRSGWGVPMATDIAFAVGILALLGKRVPAALRVLLLALAVIDDLGAIVVIALFYSSGISLGGVAVALGGIAGIVTLQRFGIRAKVLYIVPALVAWGGTYAAGIHPTIAGVIVGLLTPVRAWLGTEGFVSGVRHEIEQLEQRPPSALSAHAVAGALRHVDVARREALSPAESLIHSLHPWVAFGIMPVFALANAGVTISAAAQGMESGTVTMGVAIGLLLGKPAGVLLAIWLSLRLRFGSLPEGIGWRHLVVLGTVAGVGFTMALFIAQLAFGDPELLSAAKRGVLAASAAAGLSALALGWLLLPRSVSARAAQTADEAEASTEL